MTSVDHEMTGRMLLSHNFDVSPEQVPVLTAEEFTAVFQRAFAEHKQIQCQQIQHPHWILEIKFPSDSFSPSQIGELCAQALLEKRRSQSFSAAVFPEILVLGGLKTTPPMSDAPEALQPGEWGVDVVETPSETAFLEKMTWDATIAQKPVDHVFKVVKKEA